MKSVLVLFTSVMLIFTGYGFYLTRTVPENFPIGEVFLVNEDESLKSISKRLEEKNIVRSALWFRVWLSMKGKDRHLQLGYFVFDKPMVLGEVLKKMTVTGPDKPLIKVTIPEGKTTKEIADILKSVVSTISVDKFGEVALAKKADGYLFPSTYFLLPSSSEEKMIDKMMTLFEKEYAKNFQNETIPKVLKDRNEVVSLAAILEGEAKGEEDMKTVSGILQKRIALNMPLQVDVAAITYKTRGVPEQPIANPGTVAIGAVFNPTKSSYLYYLTGNDGAMHYAKTYTEHKANIKKYLK